MYDGMTELRVSHSSMSQFLSCPRKFEFAKMYQHARRDESLAGEVGNALHEGFQEYLRSGDEELAVFALMKRYPIHLNSNPTDPRSIEACYATLQAMMKSEHLIEYSLAEIEDNTGVIRSAIEVPFEIAIKGITLDDEGKIPFIYTGFIDLLLYNSLTEEYVVVDIKTHRQNLSDMTANYRFSEQCLPYGIVLERMLGHELDGMHVKYLSVYVDIENPKIQLYPFDIAKSEIRDWARGLYVNLMNIKTFYSMGWFPRHGNNCQAFNRPCKYFDICENRNHETIKKLILMDQTPVGSRVEEPWITLDLELAA